VTFQDILGLFFGQTLASVASSSLSVFAGGLFGFAFKAGGLIKPLAYFDGTSASTSSSKKTEDPLSPDNLRLDLFDVLYWTKYAVVFGFGYSLKLSLDWHQRNVVGNELGSRDPIETGLTPAQQQRIAREKKLEKLRNNQSLTLEEESYLMYAERVKDLDYYLGVDTPPMDNRENGADGGVTADHIKEQHG